MEIIHFSIASLSRMSLVSMSGPSQEEQSLDIPLTDEI